MGIESVLAGGLTSASTGLSWFFPVLAAALVYFQYEVMDNEAPPINIPSEVLLPSYDFIVIGAGSAGEYFRVIYCNSLLDFNSFYFPLVVRYLYL